MIQPQRQVGMVSNENLLKQLIRGLSCFFKRGKGIALQENGVPTCNLIIVVFQKR